MLSHEIQTALGCRGCNIERVETMIGHNGLSFSFCLNFVLREKYWLFKTGYYSQSPSYLQFYPTFCTVNHCSPHPATWTCSCNENCVLQEERALRNNKNYETLDTNKSGVRFRSPPLSHLNSEYVQTRDQYAEKQRAIVNEIVNIAGKRVTLPPADVCSSPSQTSGSKYMSIHLPCKFILYYPAVYSKL